jgi:hypothetical protein
MNEFRTTAFQVMLALGTGVIALTLLGVLGYGG